MGNFQATVPLQASRLYSLDNLLALSQAHGGLAGHVPLLHLPFAAILLMIHALPVTWRFSPRFMSAKPRYLVHLFVLRQWTQPSQHNLGVTSRKSWEGPCTPLVTSMKANGSRCRCKSYATGPLLRLMARQGQHSTSNSMRSLHQVGKSDRVKPRNVTISNLHLGIRP